MHTYGVKKGANLDQKYTKNAMQNKRYYPQFKNRSMHYFISKNSNYVINLASLSITLMNHNLNLNFIEDVDEWGAIIKNQTESFNRLSHLQNMAKREMMNNYGKELTKDAQNRNHTEQKVHINHLKFI